MSNKKNKRAPNGRIRAKEAPLGLMVVGYSTGGNMLTVCDTQEGAFLHFAKDRVGRKYWGFSSVNNFERWKSYREGGSYSVARIKRVKDLLWENDKPSRAKKKRLVERYAKFLAYWVSRRQPDEVTALALYQHYERVAQEAMTLAERYRDGGAAKAA